MTALVRWHDRPQEWAYRISRGGTGFCRTCGAILDGGSRFWCSRHYVSFTVRLPITQRVLQRAGLP